MIAILLSASRKFDPSGHSETFDRWWQVFCLAVSFFGLGIRAFTIGYVPSGTSGRNTHGQVAECLNTSGIYSIVRHPLYLGNFVVWLGIALFAQVWWLAVICVLVFWLYYERIMYAEEAYLRGKFGKDFDAWAENTPAFIPRFKNWRKPNLPFSLRNVLRREYNGFFTIIITMFVLEIAGNLSAEGKPDVDLMWGVLLAVGIMVWMVLRTLKKRTTLLHVEGR